MANRKIRIINGPNLNLLGTREPGIYGDQTFEEQLAAFAKEFPKLEIDYFQSNVEGELINSLHEAAREDRKSTRLNSSHTDISRMPSSA